MLRKSIAISLFLSTKSKIIISVFNPFQNSNCFISKELRLLRIRRNLGDNCQIENLFRAGLIFWLAKQSWKWRYSRSLSGIMSMMLIEIIELNMLLNES